MGTSFLSYDRLIIFPYELLHLRELKITRKINEHGKLYFTGIIDKDKKDMYIDKTREQTNVEVYKTNDADKKEVIFKGVVINVEVQSVRDIYYIEVEALSHTYNLDVKYKNRSFQDKSISYETIIKNVTYEYAGADVIDMGAAKKATGKLIMQYMETDWEFLKRLASQFNTGLVPEVIFDTPKYYFGMPTKQSSINLEVFNYTIKKKIADYRISSENHIDGLQENDFINYEIETETKLDIGNQVQFNGKTLFVSEIMSTMENGLFVHRYTLTPKKGLSQNKVYNEKLTGASLEGYIVDVKNSSVKIHLEVDNGQNKKTACWFAYSTIYSSKDGSGWYCMPEIKDRIRLYFPNNEEDNAFVSSSAHQDPREAGMRDNPDIKSIRTKFQKEIRFTENGIQIISKEGDTFINLLDDGGIEIQSNKGIKLISDENIIMEAKKDVTIIGKEGIELMNGNLTSININENIEVKGQEVKIN